MPIYRSHNIPISAFSKREKRRIFAERHARRKSITTESCIVSRRSDLRPISTLAPLPSLPRTHTHFCCVSRGLRFLLRFARFCSALFANNHNDGSLARTYYIVPIIVHIIQATRYDTRSSFYSVDDMYAGHASKLREILSLLSRAATVRDRFFSSCV